MVNSAFHRSQDGNKVRTVSADAVRSISDGAYQLDWPVKKRAGESSLPFLVPMQAARKAYSVENLFADARSSTSFGY